MPSTDNADAAATHVERSLTASVKLYYDLYTPHGDVEQSPRPLLVALHGYGANKRQMMHEARLIAPPSFMVASLQGFHQHLKEPKEEGGPLRFGFGWVTNFRPEDSIALHHSALKDLMTTLVDEGLADARRVFLLGFSQSCAVNYRFAFTHNETLRGVVGICGGLPGDWETSNLYQSTKASVLHLHGTRDQFYPPSRVSDYTSQLALRAEAVEVRSYDAGHEITPAMRNDTRAWLESQAAL